MMSEKFLSELARRLRQEGIAMGQAENRRLPVLIDGQETMVVNSTGIVLLRAEAADDPKASLLYDTVTSISSEVHEYIEAMTDAPRLEAKGLDEDFRLLAEFNGVVLAGLELERDWGYKFVTWQRSLDHTAVERGDYYYNDYTSAKLDFACRAGLVQESRQLTDEQLTEVYRCVYETLDSEYPMTKERENMLAAVLEQIKYSVDDLEERVNLSNQRELEIIDQQAGDSPGLNF